MAKQEGNAPQPAKSGANAEKAARLQRRAQALRDNLKRRKEQERARKEAPKPQG